MPPSPIRVILPGLLRELAGGVAEIEVSGDAADPGRTDAGQGACLTVADVLDRAFAEHRILDAKVRDERGRIRRHVKVFVDGEDATRGDGTSTAVPPGARVHIINAVSGG
ncbi:MAG TPA: MoaD/ThiS family protein [Intrasporangium sp.]|uniref:MoaD/ThiS family protein n=1 Tax=Intrasporangium sp. TaxID=1925024 RepID=UPI002D78D6FA|nr:MoaD/ThiS family protein [Intrasporangium sp.]HET7397746.1 MoaD/ThiS family protein [Intrasporangium sp.]